MRNWLAWSLAAGAVLAAVVVLTLKRSSDAARCPEGLNAVGARCCGQGQTVQHGRCTGSATSCAAGMIASELAGERHCQRLSQRVPIAAGTLDLGPTDWESGSTVAPRRITVNGFSLDDSEVTWGRYQGCVATGACAAIGVPVPAAVEPGLPITRVSPEQAIQICAALGGRLPTGDEWVFAAAGPMGRRYPWGSTGLVCRRAAFGLTAGPCAWHASIPELAGARPDGAAESGLLDLAGNVAEWTREPDGFRARGGSFSSNVAGQLKSWASITATAPASDIGFRCAYDQR